MSHWIDTPRPEGTHSFIQWKGTDACLDFECECGTYGHFDGWFAYAIRCPGCGTVWEAPSHIVYRKVDDEDAYTGCIVDLQDESSDEGGA